MATLNIKKLQCGLKSIAARVATLETDDDEHEISDQNLKRQLATLLAQQKEQQAEFAKRLADQKATFDTMLREQQDKLAQLLKTIPRPITALQDLPVVPGGKPIKGLVPIYRCSVYARTNWYPPKIKRTGDTDAQVPPPALEEYKMDSAITFSVTTVGSRQNPNPPGAVWVLLVPESGAYDWPHCYPLVSAPGDGTRDRFVVRWGVQNGRAGYIVNFPPAVPPAYNKYMFNFMLYANA